jgi:hypothetical protein
MAWPPESTACREASFGSEPYGCYAPLVAVSPGVFHRSLATVVFALLLALALPRCGSRSGLGLDDGSAPVDAATEPFVDPCWDPDLDWEECCERNDAFGRDYSCSYYFWNWSGCVAVLNSCPASCAPGFVCALVGTIGDCRPTPWDGSGYVCAPCSRLPEGHDGCPPGSGIES